MHPKVLSTDGWAVVRRLSAAGLLQSWTLAGGTGLALQIGHRYSEDLDFFRHGSWNPDYLVGALVGVGKVVVQSRSADKLHVVVDGLRVSFLEAQAPLLCPGTSYRGLRVADTQDIAVMKVVAIGGRGSRKDFVDLYFYLRGAGGLDSVFALLRRRFTEVDYNEYHLLKSLVFFEDAETEPMPMLIRDVSWHTIKHAIVTEVKRVS